MPRAGISTGHALPDPPLEKEHDRSTGEAMNRELVEGLIAGQVESISQLRLATATPDAIAMHETALAAQTEGICRKCGGSMKPSKAIEQTYTGSPDFIGGEVVTISPGGTGKLIDCLKCEKCGWSVT